jgi:uncharacterized small protein (DUF1192 family)
MSEDAAESSVPSSAHSDEPTNVSKTLAGKKIIFFSSLCLSFPFFKIHLGFNDYYNKTVDTFMTKIGAVPNPSDPVPAELETTVQEIIAKGLEGGGPPNDTRVSDIVWGWPIDGSAERQKAVFYRLAIGEAQAETGFTLHCKSKNKSKLRVFVYDKNGVLLEKADAFRTRNKSVSQAVIAFLNSETLRMESEADDGVISLFSKSPDAVLTKLNGLVPNTARALAAGPYLIAVYIDNALLNGPYSLVALPAKPGDEVAAVLHADASITEAKQRLSLLQLEFARTKAAYDATLVKMKDEDDLTDALLQSREDAYRGFLLSCGSVYNSLDETGSTTSSAVEFDEFDKDKKPNSSAGAPIDASKLFRAATTSASLASGWLSARFASGLSAMHRGTSVHENASVTSSTEGHYAETVKGEPEEEEYPASPAPSNQPEAPEEKRRDALDAIFESVSGGAGAAGTTREELEDL